MATINDFVLGDLMQVIMKLWEVFKDKDFDYDDKPAFMSAVEMAIEELGKQAKWTPELIQIRQNIAAGICQEIFYHLKPKPMDKPVLPY